MINSTSILTPTSGEVYKNQTFKYIVQYFNSIDPYFFKATANVMSLGFGIGDQKNASFKGNDALYMLVDTWGIYQKGYTHKSMFMKYFDIFKNYIQKKEYFLGMYPFEETHQLQMIVLRIDDKDLIPNFIEGNFSKMYKDSPFHVESLQHKVITLDESTKEKFVDKLNNHFGSCLYTEDVEEADMKPIFKQEIFNYGESNI